MSALWENHSQGLDSLLGVWKTVIQVKFDQIMDLEELSFINCVRFYKTQLLQIKDGCKSESVFTKHKTKALARDGVLVVDYSRRPYKHELTPRTIQTLIMINQESNENI